MRRAHVLVLLAALVLSATTTPAHAEPVADDGGWSVIANGETYHPDLLSDAATGEERGWQRMAPAARPGLLLDLVDRIQCNLRKRPKHEIVRYGAAAVGKFRGGRISLTCGNARHGYSHIKIKHERDWKDKLRSTGGYGRWDDFMSFATSQSLRHPALWADHGSGKYCYTTPITIVHRGRVVDTFYPTVAVSTNNRWIISSFPGGRCRRGT
jgi:hypothetical protein